MLVFISPVLQRGVAGTHHSFPSSQPAAPISGAAGWDEGKNTRNHLCASPALKHGANENSDHIEWLSDDGSASNRSLYF